MSAIPTSEEYDLEKLRKALIKQDLYTPVFVDEDTSAEPGLLLLQSWCQ
jgi:hypothetical protein